MRAIKLLLAFAIFAGLLRAQGQIGPVPPPTVFVAVDPAGSCGSGAANQYNYALNKYWGCSDVAVPNTFVWTQIAGGSGAPGTVTSLTFDPPLVANPNPATTTSEISCPTCVSGTTPGYQPNQPLIGCPVQYVSGLTFHVGQCTYTINGVTYISPAQDVTSAAADVTNPRIDSIIACADSISPCSGANTTVILQGTAATPDAVPVPEPSTQIEITHYEILANGTTPNNVTATLVYDETGGAEWVASSSSGRIVVNSTSNPYHLTKDIEATAAQLNDTFTLTVPAAGTVDLGAYNNGVIPLFIRSKATWPTGGGGASAARFITLQFLNGSTVKGNAVTIRSGQFGFDSSITNAYQMLGIATSLFGINGVAVTALRGTISGNSGTSTIGFYIDFITIQSGFGPGPLPGTIMNFRGTWNSTSSYSVNDVVVNANGMAFLALLPNVNVALSTAATWRSLAVPTAGTTTTLLHGNASGAPTYSGVSLTADTLANQGTTTTVLHGNASGQPSFGAVANADLSNSAITINGTSVSLGGTRTLSLASADYVNQGTTTTVLHGNASGNPSFTSVGTTDLAANAVGSSQMAVVNTRRVCSMVAGADNAASVLVNGDLGPQGRQCYIPYAATIVELMVAGDGGTPNVIVGRNRAGSISNIVSSALATASAGGLACSNTGGTTGLDGATTCTNTLQNTGINAGDWLELVSGTAGGVAKRMSIDVTYTVN